MSNKIKQLLLVNGQSMPQKGFGSYKITDQSMITSAIKYAYDAGYRLFDTTQLYKNEAEVGDALQESGLPREDLFTIARVSEPNQGFKQTIASVKDSLQKLKFDYVNLLLIHWPIERAFSDTWAALEELKKEGLIHSIGVSNYQMIHLQYLATQAHEMPVINQIERHSRLNQQPLLQCDKEYGIVTQAWSPFGRGTILDNLTLNKIAANHHKSAAQVVLRWHLQSGVAFIPKSVHEARIKQNINIYDFTSSDEEMTVINSLSNFTRIGKKPALVHGCNLKY